MYMKLIQTCTYIVQVIEALFVGVYNSGCKTMQLKVKITVMESDTENFQWYFIRCKFLFDFIDAT